MKSYLKNNKDYCFGIVTILFAVLAVCFSTVARFIPFLLMAHYICEILALWAYWNCFRECYKAKNDRFLNEMILLNLVVGFVGICVFVKSIPILLTEGRMEYLLSELLVILAVVGIIVYDAFCREFVFGNFIRKFGVRIKEFIVNHIGLIIFLFIFVIVSIVSGGNQPRWDAAYFFRYLDNCSISSVFYIPQLSFISHINLSYSMLNLIAELLTGDLYLGMTILNISLAALSGLSVYGIFRIILPKCSEVNYVLATAAYLFSPFLLGMVNNNYWDFWVVCLLPILFYLILKKYWILETIAAFIFCFVKETAVVVYAFMCMGILISEWLQLKGLPVKDRCLALMARRKYWVMILTGLVWMGIYIIMPNWSGNGNFALEPAYVKSKLAVLFGLNFNWILTLAGAAGGIVILFHRKKTQNRVKWILPLLLGDLSFILFSCFFVTVNHARYIDAHFPILFIFGIWGICMIQYDKLRTILLSVLTLLSLIQSYYTLDPVTKCLFVNYNVGKTTMISATRDEYLADSMVYNQQYQYFDRALNLALKEAVEDADAKIIFPAIHDKTWCFDGFAETTENVKDYYVSRQYWDNVKNMRCILPGRDRIAVDVYNVSAQGNWEAVVKNEKCYYFYVSFAGSEIAQNIREKYKVLEETEWEYRGWIVHRIEFGW